MAINLIRNMFSIMVLAGGSNAVNTELDYRCVFIDCSWSINPEQMNEKEI